MYKLKNTGSPYDEFVLKGGAYRLGSATDNEFVLENPSVAPHHCEILVTSNTIMVQNLSSTHETFIDDQQIDSARLALGQTLRLGTVTLVLKGDNEAAAVVAAAPSTPVQAVASSVAKSVVQIPKSLLWTLLLLILVGGLAAVIYTHWPPAESQGRSAKNQATSNVGGAKKAPQPPRKKEKPMPEDAAHGRAEAHPQTEPPTEPHKSETPPHFDSAPARTAEPIKTISAETLMVLQRPFSIDDVHRDPTLDVQAAELRISEGDLPRAQPFLQRALRNQQKAHGIDHPEVTKTLDVLANVYRNVRQPDKAEPLLKQALSNTEKLHGPDHPETARTLDKLGETLLAAGEPSSAVPLLERALKIREKALQPDQRDIAASLNNLATAHLKEGDYAKAKPLLERELKSAEKSGAVDEPRLARTLGNLGEIARATGDAEQAEPLLKRALNLKERVLPPTDPSLAKTLRSLAALHVAKGELAKAEPLYARALDINENALGTQHPQTAESLKDLARLNQAKGEPAKAAALFQRAAEAAENSLGPEHPQTAKSLSDWAQAYGCESDPAPALEAAKRAVRAQYQLLAKIVRYGSEEQRLAHRNRLNPYSLAATLNTIPELASAILRCKGVVLDSLLEDQRIAEAGRDPQLRTLVERLTTTKQSLAEMLFEIPEDFGLKERGRRQSDINTLAAYLKVLENDAAKKIPGLGRAQRALDITVDQVKWVIPEQSVLLEWIRYSCCLETNQWQQCYGVMILARNGDPRWVSLGSAKTIDENIFNFQKTIQTNGGASTPDQTNTAASPLESQLQALFKQLWVPIEPFLPSETKTIIVSPDGGLSFVPFATLLTASGEFLGGKYTYRYVASGRDLLEEKKSMRRGSVSIFGSPEFSASSAASSEEASTNAPALREIDRAELKSLRFPTLSAAAQEVALVHVQARGWNWPVTLFFGPSANEPELANLRAPRVLHLATSAFLLPDSAEESDESLAIWGIEPQYESSFANTPTNRSFVSATSNPFSKVTPMKNPLRRSGLALSGAAATLKSWEQGANPRRSHDGILTCDELGTLKLDGTEVVILSVCDSGPGIVDSGEALLALRRAFVQAGAQNLLVALRPQHDEQAANMIAHFYRRFHEIGDAPLALADVQRFWLERLRKENDLATAVRVAGMFVMSSKGAAPSP